MAQKTKMRRFQFKRVEIIDEGPEGQSIKRGFLDYYMTAKEILCSPSGRDGFGSEDVLLATAIYAKLREAKRLFEALEIVDPLEENKKLPEGEKFVFDPKKHRLEGQLGEVFLDNESYTFLKKRMDGHRWGAAHEVITDFINYVRDLKEEEVTVVPSS